MEILGESSLAETDWRTIAPNEHGDWIGQRSANFHTLHPLTASDASGAMGEPAPIFVRRTLGLKTNRDVWCYNSSKTKLSANISHSLDFYNDQVRHFLNEYPTAPTLLAKEREKLARSFASKDERHFHWDARNYRDLSKGVRYSIDESRIRTSAYRPFFKQRLYFSPEQNNSIRHFPQIFPGHSVRNLGISATGPASNSPFHVLMTDTIPESCLTAVNSVYMPRWYYANGKRVSNINPQALAEFRARYGDRRISDDDLFYYVYAVLHSPQYREAFANDLSKSQARVPMAATLADFRAFANAGRELAGLHVGYESVPPHPLEEIPARGWNPSARDAFRVTKMRYPGRRGSYDKTRIAYNAGVTLAGVPEKAHEYVLGTRSALDWLIERYQVKTHKASGITNDPNDWATEAGDPRYIFNLIKRVTAVSVRTVDIVAGLPELPLN